MIIIGEKINGSIPSMGKAIAARDEEYIRNMAIKQAEAGAHFIDVCASVPPEEEYEVLKWMLEIVQMLLIHLWQSTVQIRKFLCKCYPLSKARHGKLGFHGRQ